MTRAVRLIVFVFAVCLLSTCSGGADGAGTGPSLTDETLSLKLETAHFRLWADRAPAAMLRAISDRLENDNPRFAADLGVTDLQTTTVEVWSDAESFYRHMQATIGRRFDGSKGYVTGPFTAIILDGSDAPARATHELVHCLSLRVNRTIANNPRWLWETVALYVNQQFVDPRTLTYMRSGNYPTIAQLDADYAVGHQIYEVGYVLGEFIVTTWGQAALRRLVETNGDIGAVLQLTVPQFEQRWHTFLRDRYFPADADARRHSSAQ